MAQGSRSSGKNVQAPIRVWDPVVRLFHWSVVLFCLLEFAVFTDGKSVHRWIGYGVAVALAIRIVWGFVGSNTPASPISCLGPARL